MIGKLSEQYESNGDPGCVSSGYGDAGGVSFGLYQLSTAAGSVQAFVDWLRSTDNPFGDELTAFSSDSQEFADKWRGIAQQDPDGFGQAQHDYIQYAYYEPAIGFLADAGFNIANHSEVMKDVVWSRSVQYGPALIVEMFEAACHSLGYESLSYVDAANFDADMIQAIYLTVCKSVEWTNGSPGLRSGLYARFDSECQEALARLEG